MNRTITRTLIKDRDTALLCCPYALSAWTILDIMDKMDWDVNRVAQAMYVHPRSVFRFIKGRKYVKPLYISRLKAAAGAE